MKKAKKISAYVWPHGGAIICEEKDCLFDKECANHNSAGDFRSEDGMSPKLSIKGDFVYCHTAVNNGISISETGGAINIKHFGHFGITDLKGSYERHLKAGCAACETGNISGVKCFKITGTFHIYFEEIKNLLYIVDEISEFDISNGVPIGQKHYCLQRGTAYVTSILCTVKGDSLGGFYLGSTLEEARNELIRRLKEGVDNPAESNTDRFTKVVTKLYNSIKP